MSRTINKFSQVGSSNINILANVNIVYFLFFSARPFVNYFVPKSIIDIVIKTN
jgi:hypothetical protein